MYLVDTPAQPMQDHTTRAREESNAWGGGEGVIKVQTLTDLRIDPTLIPKTHRKLIDTK